jgi:ATPase subunit of ABC transporter with duplicated ATPase domains
MLFAGDDGVKKVNVLSGGEKVRCQLSKMMISGANCLIFDEPTNHLDMESISALNEGMIKFPGVELIACRDHQVVQTTANRIIEILPDGSIIDKVTTYDDYLANNADARKRTVYEASRDEDSN